MNFEYDVIVIGSGSGWLTVSIGLAAAGKKVAMVERWLIGGDCTNFWCVPSKALIDIAKKKDHADLKDALSQARARRQLIQDEETVEKVEKYGMKIFKWIGSFKDKNTILIDGKQEITANKIVISTGSHSMKFDDLKWVDAEDILTNETIFELDENIKSLVVVWGGYIGCELAEAFANLWVKVHIVQRNTDLVPREEKESKDLLFQIFKNKGIEVHTSHTISDSNAKEITIEHKTTKKTQKITFDKVLVALGRTPNTKLLSLETVGISYDRKGIAVDKYNRTNIKNIFAIGDCVAGNPQFTHWANNEWRGVIRNIILPFPKSSTRNAVLPAVLYTNSEIARVGKTEEELIKKYSAEWFHTEILHFEHNDRSKVTEDTTWFIKIHFKRISWKILWATVMGSHAGEILPLLSSAMQNNISGHKLAKLVYPYPTKAELVKRVCDKFVVHTLSNAKKEAVHFLKANKLQLLTALVWGTMLGSFIYYKSAYNLSVEDIAFQLYNFIGGSSIWPIIFIIAYILRPIVFFPWAIMTIMAWALYGLWFGLLYIMLWATLSALSAYILWAIFGKKMVDTAEDGWMVANLKAEADKSPFTSILMTRLLFLPFDPINYIAGFLKVNVKAFLLATAIGILPGTAVFVFAGTAFHGKELTSFSDVTSNIDIKTLLFAWIIFAVIMFLTKILKKKQSK